MTALCDEFDEPLEIPCEEDLPDSDGIPMDSHRQALQMTLLAQTATHYFRDRTDVYVGMNMFVYFSPGQLKTHDFRGPDVFVVTGTDKRERRRWVVWQEGKGPDVVIEILSETTRTVDKTTKKDIYATRLRVPEYFWYNPFSGERAGWVLHGSAYEPLVPDEHDGMPSHLLGLTLVRWHGVYEGVEAPWLRWATLDGVVIPTPQEAAGTARADADAARAEAERAMQDASTARAEAERERQLRCELEARIAELERQERKDDSTD
jgi:Uma2 family endonuclease